MGDEASEEIKGTLIAAYQEVCRSYHRIDDFRAKLLGFLPLASGVGLVLLLRDTGLGDAQSWSNSPFLIVAGVFGSVITVGLLFYELRGIQRCIRLAKVGAELEHRMGVDGQFRRWPHSLARFINEPVAGALIYSAVFSAWVWVFVGSLWTSLCGALVASAVSFAVCFIAAWWFYRHVR